MKLSPEFAARFDSNPSFENLFSIKGEVFRDVCGRKTQRFVLENNGYFIKAHSGVGWVEIFKNLFLGRMPVLGANNEYEAIKKLTKLGVETMKWVAYGSRGLNPACLKSFIITEELTETISLEDFCTGWPSNPPAFRFKQTLIARVATMVKILHENGINHRDLYICHFLINSNFEKSDKLQLYLIDLHRVQIRPKTPFRWRLKDIAALYYSSMDIGLTKGDLYRFIRVYSDKPLRSAFEKDKVFWKKVRIKAGQLQAKKQSTT